MANNLVRILIWLVMLIGGAILGILIDASKFSALQSSIVWHILSFIVGLTLLKLVLTISRNTGRWLAKLGREGDIPRMQTNRLAKEGPYSCMRHPMHMGLFLFPFVMAFLIGSVSFILIIAPLEVLLMIIMIIFLEEPEAIKKFGNKYKEYMKQTPRFNLNSNCLKYLLIDPKK